MTAEPDALFSLAFLAAGPDGLAEAVAAVVATEEVRNAGNGIVVGWLCDMGLETGHWCTLVQGF